MDQWIEGLVKTIFDVLGRPQSQIEFYACAGVGLIVGLIVLSKVAAAVDAFRPDLPWAIMTGIIGIVVVLITMTAVRIYVEPTINAKIARWIVPGSAVGISLIIVIPLMCGVQKMNYLAGVITWAISCAAMAIIIFMIGAGFDLLSAGKKSGKAAGRLRDASTGYMDLLGQQ